MDQIAALHWIKENILKFGGDPENITLIGYEAGAACIHYLMASPAVTPGEERRKYGLILRLHQFDSFIRSDINPKGMIVLISLRFN